jgi:predicted O-methyltransferase YrrM
MRQVALSFIIPCIVLAAGWPVDPSGLQVTGNPSNIDAQVRQFLESRRWSWRDMNVPASDGQVLYNIIAEHKYKNALEIGTSTGHSGIWIAWALSKTGGKLLTIEIDRSRHEEALANFRSAGVAKYVDARLGDAHEIVPALEGPFDFVFCDADKDWYKNYLAAVLPKMTVGSCFAAHNISEWGYGRDFLQYARGIPYLETTLLGSRGSGMSASYKKSAGPDSKN